MFLYSVRSVTHPPGFIIIVLVAPLHQDPAFADIKRLILDLVMVAGLQRYPFFPGPGFAAVIAIHKFHRSSPPFFSGTIQFVAWTSVYATEIHGSFPRLSVKMAIHDARKSWAFDTLLLILQSFIPSTDANFPGGAFFFGWISKTFPWLKTDCLLPYRFAAVSFFRLASNIVGDSH